MIQYETPRIEITYFDEIRMADAGASDPSFRTAAQNMNTAAFQANSPIAAVAARTVRVNTILKFQ